MVSDFPRIPTSWACPFRCTLDTESGALEVLPGGRVWWKSLKSTFSLTGTGRITFRKRYFNVLPTQVRDFGISATYAMQRLAERGVDVDHDDLVVSGHHVMPTRFRYRYGNLRIKV